MIKYWISPHFMTDKVKWENAHVTLFFLFFLLWIWILRTSLLPGSLGNRHWVTPWPTFSWYAFSVVTRTDNMDCPNLDLGERMNVYLWYSPMLMFLLRTKLNVLSVFFFVLTQVHCWNYREGLARPLSGSQTSRVFSEPLTTAGL